MGFRHRWTKDRCRHRWVNRGSQDRIRHRMDNRWTKDRRGTKDKRPDLSSLRNLRCCCIVICLATCKPTSRYCMATDVRNVATVACMLGMCLLLLRADLGARKKWGSGAAVGQRGNARGRTGVPYVLKSRIVLLILGYIGSVIIDVFVT